MSLPLPNNSALLRMITSLGLELGISLPAVDVISVVIIVIIANENINKQRST
jgi:hypothetical protein